MIRSLPAPPEMAVASAAAVERVAASAAIEIVVVLAAIETVAAASAIERVEVLAAAERVVLVRAGQAVGAPSVPLSLMPVVSFTVMTNDSACVRPPESFAVI